MISFLLMILSCIQSSNSVAFIFGAITSGAGILGVILGSEIANR
jgi:hypothetical protein